MLDGRVGVPHRLPVVLQVLPESKARIIEDPEYTTALDFEVCEFLVLDLPFNGAEHLVDVDPELALSRLVEFRGMKASDAKSRMRNQASRQDRLAKADFVLDNSGTLQHLDDEVDRCWNWIQRS